MEIQGAAGAGPRRQGVDLLRRRLSRFRAGLPRMESGLAGDARARLNVDFTEPCPERNGGG